MYYHVAKESHNSKTGNIVVTTSSKSTCPETCPLYMRCYPSIGHLSIHWNKVSSGERGTLFNEHISILKHLPENAIIRGNVAGDQPGENLEIDPRKMAILARAMVYYPSRIAWTYTHKPLTPSNVEAIIDAIRVGYVVNISTNNLTEADEVFERGFPTVTLLPWDLPEGTKTVKTPENNTVVVCPATYSDLTCKDCKLCARPVRNIVGFPLHAVNKKKLQMELNLC